eukprot:258554-Alexandrium_andersonii.AAC.1
MRSRAHVPVWHDGTSRNPRGLRVRACGRRTPASAKAHALDELVAGDPQASVLEVPQRGSECWRPAAARAR